MMKLNVFLLLFSLAGLRLYSQQMISEKPSATLFAIVNGKQATPLYVDENDFTVVKKTVELFKTDIESVTGKEPIILHNTPPSGNVIIIGTAGKSKLIDQLITQGKLKIDSIKNKWEAYQVQVVKNPFNNVSQALVITGSDRRGTAYAVFELAAQMGVSPWHYWADVPAQKKKQLYYKGGIHSDAPKVKYRGIFINDEAPALSGWSKEKFGGFNHKFYEKVFELILRMKGNYLWPAMWGSAFNDDDTLNAATADDYAIVMGTSHHEPLTRAHDEWRRYGKGKWNYDSNATNLQAFWKKGMERMGTSENIVSIGMRGDGDEPMTRGTATALLERIVHDQREIIANVTGKPASKTPQLWALYKEVQDYYDKGMRVPDDVTLLLCDDNWGNIRKLPSLNEAKHPGGYGIYYHFDYVGGPRNYKWINTNQIERTWEQMHLAYAYGADKIWIVNVGDIKPMELPTQFFLDYAWNPEKIQARDLPGYYTQWAAGIFGKAHAGEIGRIAATYSKYNSRRKPELLDANTYSLHHYKEASRVTADYENLLMQADSLNSRLAPELRDAYFQLILHPVKASANLYQLYTAVAYNRWFASQNGLAANRQADKAKLLYLNDSLITEQYHRIANGKWNHMMDQTHIGYTYWQQPLVNKMPQVKYIMADSAMEQPTLITPRDQTAEAMLPRGVKRNIFYEKNGYVSIEAPHYTAAKNSNGITWKVIPNLGRTLGAITPFPVTAAAKNMSATSPRVEYETYFYDTGAITLQVYLSPTLPFHNKGLQYAISVDDEQPQVIDMHEGYNDRLWNKWAAENIIIKTSTHRLQKPGKHIIKFWMVDPGVVLQKIVADAGGLKESYLGPEETIEMPRL